MAGTKIKYRHSNDGRGEEIGKRTAIDFSASRDRTVQSAKQDTDINVIVKRFGLTNLPKPNVEPFYGDFSQVEDYRSAIERVRAAEEAFMTLPSATRKRFQNSPVELMEFIADDRNYEEARKLGLLRPEAAGAAPGAPAPGLASPVVARPTPVDPGVVRETAKGGVPPANNAG